MRLRQLRNRVVLFRLSEQEHQELEQLCAARGGRSLSEFVRVQVLNPAFSADIARLLELAESLERRLSSLQEMHDELSRRIQSLQAQPSAKSARTGAGGEA
jgi:hypothetical protein